MTNEQKLSGEFDAAVWAKEFMRVNKELHIADSEATMIGWFANAIEQSHSVRQHRAKCKPSPDAAAIRDGLCELAAAVRSIGRDQWIANLNPFAGNSTKPPYVLTAEQ